MVLKLMLDGEYIDSLITKVRQQLTDFPAAKSLADSQGGTSAVTKDLRAEIDRAAAQLSLTATKVIADVNDLHDEIKAAVAALVEADASMADVGKALLKQLDSAAVQDPARSAGTGTGTGSGTGGGPTVSPGTGAGPGTTSKDIAY